MSDPFYALLLRQNGIAPGYMSNRMALARELPAKVIPCLFDRAAKQWRNGEERTLDNDDFHAEGRLDPITFTRLFAAL